MASFPRSAAILLSIVGLVDTAAFLGPWLNLPALLEFANAFDSLFSSLGSSSSNAEEGLHNQVHNLVDAISDPKQRQALIPLPLIKFLRRRVPALLPLVSFKPLRSHEAAAQRLAEQRALIAERTPTRPGLSSDKSFRRRTTAKEPTLIQRANLLRRRLTEALAEWWAPRSKHLARAFFRWLNDVGYMARQSPVKLLVRSILGTRSPHRSILGTRSPHTALQLCTRRVSHVRGRRSCEQVTLLDMYSLVELMHFLTHQLPTVFRAIKHGEGLYWLTHSVQASVLGTTLTFLATTDFVRQFTKVCAQLQPPYTRLLLLVRRYAAAAHADTPSDDHAIDPRASAARGVRERPPGRGGAHSHT